MGYGPESSQILLTGSPLIWREPIHPCGSEKRLPDCLTWPYGGHETLKRRATGL